MTFFRSWLVNSFYILNQLPLLWRVLAGFFYSSNFFDIFFILISDLNSVRLRALWKFFVLKLQAIDCPRSQKLVKIEISFDRSHVVCILASLASRGRSITDWYIIFGGKCLILTPPDKVLMKIRRLSFDVLLRKKLIAHSIAPTLAIKRVVLT